MLHAAVRSAGEDDLARVAAWLSARDVRVEPLSLRTRLAEEDGGILVSDRATLSWALDGGALHVYDLAGEHADYEALVAAADAIARARFAAVLTTTLYEDDPSLGTLRAIGFEPDWSEGDVRAGEAVRLVALARQVS
jgi:hypothetical protein